MIKNLRINLTPVTSFFLILTLFTGVSVSSFAAQPNCSQYLPGQFRTEAVYKAFQGRLITSGPFSAKEFKRNQIYFLGEGEGGGGRVYRLVSKVDHSSRIIKIYEDPDQLTNDVQALNELFDLGKDLPIEVVRAKKLYRDRLEVQDVRGHTLKDVILYNMLPQAELDRLQNLFSDYLFLLNREVLRRFNESEFSELDLTDDEFFVRLSPSRLKGDQIGFFIKSDNFIVEEGTLKLFLIDPF